MRIAAEFFETCAETYVDHGSNEFDLPDTPVRREIVQAAYQLWSRTKRGTAPDEIAVHRRRIDAVDYTLFHYFAVRWGALAQEVGGKKAITPPLGQEELLTAASLLELLSHNDYDEYARASDDPDHGLPPTPEGRQLAEAARPYVTRGAKMRKSASRWRSPVNTAVKFISQCCSPTLPRDVRPWLKSAPLQVIR